MWWVILFTLLLACQGQNKAGDYPDYLRVADKDDVPTLDPALGYDTASWQFEDLIFETLVDYGDDGAIVGELAQKWTNNKDGTRFTFALRDDAFFSHGRPVTAHDVRFGLTRVVARHGGSPGREFFLSIRGAAACETAGCEVSGISIPDEHTLVIELEQPDPLLLHKLALPFASAVPPEVIEKIRDDFGFNPIGSGPFKLVERIPGQRLVFVPNPYYRAPRPVQLPGIVRFVGVTEDLAWMRYRMGLLDLATIPTAEFPLVAHDARLRSYVHSVDALRTQYVGLNCTRPPLDDIRVRQALNYAVDRAKLLAILNDRGTTARGVIPPTMPGYREHDPVYPLDRERAKQLLQQAGVGEGFQATLWLRNDETAMRIAQSIQQDWALVGVRIRLKPLAWGPFLDAVRHDRSVDMFLLGWEADFPDPSNFLDVLFHSRQIGINNHTYYASNEVDALLDQAATTSDPEKRSKLYREAEARIVRDAPWVFLYHPKTFLITSRRVRGFRLHPWRPPRLAHVWIEDGGQ
ncbi:MAG: peptide ABC transporter substrate-binding protein [Candidatus Binatia bacterium]|nr:MAG: peptide ABC transporter substrate-binding protein [Candidatus Binatia bacterium]